MGKEFQSRDNFRSRNNQDASSYVRGENSNYRGNPRRQIQKDRPSGQFQRGRGGFQRGRGGYQRGDNAAQRGSRGSFRGSRPQFRDNSGQRPQYGAQSREGFRPRSQSRGPRPQYGDRSRDGYKPREQYRGPRPQYGAQSRDGFKPRDQSREGFRPRDQSREGFKPRDQSREGFRPRDQSREGFRPRDQSRGPRPQYRNNQRDNYRPQDDSQTPRNDQNNKMRNKYPAGFNSNSGQQQRSQHKEQASQQRQHKRDWKGKQEHVERGNSSGEKFRERSFPKQQEKGKAKLQQSANQKTKQEDKMQIEDGANEEDVTNQKIKQQEKSKGKKNRLIIRNIGFDITQKHLKKLLLRFGEIVDVEVPKNPNNQKLNKGFGFVEFANFRSCQKAIKELNMTKYKGRDIVIDFSLSKQRFMTQKMAEEGNKIEEEQPQKIDQEQNEQGQKNQEQEHQEQQVAEEAVPETQQDIKAKLDEQRKAEDLSCTIFIRNLPSGITTEQLKEHFSKYGKVRWARIVVDHETGTPKGTAFVKYLKSQHANAIIEYSRSYEMFLLGKLPRFRTDPHMNLEIDGTIVKIFPVIKRESIAQKLKERTQAEQQKSAPSKLKPLKKIKRIEDLIMFDKEGKRRIALADIGFWQSTQEMEEEDQIRFKAHAKEKIQKLKNPNFAVSDKRVIIKFLEKDITEEQIKTLAMDFLRNNKVPTRQLTFCKLMLDSERKKSAGFAFLQFSQHETAKNFIQALAEHQEVLMNKPFVVEFALQDSRKLKKLQKK